MRIVFSRKGFDSSYGGAPSPIVDGRPVSLPIPASRGEKTRYGSLGLGRLVGEVSRGKFTGRHRCHDDPMFGNGHCWLGQVGAAQGHLAKHGVGAGDVFLFFGLFAEPETGERHHRLFGRMQVTCHGTPDAVSSHPDWREPPRPHPHASGEWHANNTIWHGQGGVARRALPELRLTVTGGPLNRWNVPGWLGEHGLTYHGKAERWAVAGELDSVKRGQEFVCDVGDASEPRAWVEKVVGLMEG